MLDTVTCDCELFENRYCHHRSREIADYLRALAGRVDRGEVRHISLSVHPVAALGLTEEGHGRT